MKRLLLIVAIIATWPSGLAAELTNHWPMQETSGTTLTDVIGGNTATISSGTIATVAGPGGTLPSGIAGDGSTYYTFDTPLNTDPNTTWSILIRGDGLGIHAMLGTGGANAERAVWVGGAQLRVQTTARTDDYFFDETYSGTGWHSILITHAANDDLRVFMDGIESTTGAVTHNGEMDSPRLQYSNTAAAGSGDNVCDLRVYDSDESSNAAALHVDYLGVPAQAGVTQSRRRRSRE